MITIVRGTTKKPLSSQQLIDFFENNPKYEGYLYMGYPIVGTPEGPFPIDALWVSPEKGVVIFNLAEGIDLGEFADLQDDSANKLEAKFRTHRALMKGRKLLVDLNAVTFAPVKDNVAAAKISTAEYPVCNMSNLGVWLDSLHWQDNAAYDSLLAVIQSVSSIRKSRRKRVVVKDDSRGAKLKQLEDSIANLDNRQGQAVIETVEGVQRIRGLAGSGKTIVLALKAAYLHAQHPDWKIAVTFHTRSLKNQFRQLINTFSIEQTSEEPDWRNLHIIHAWGAPGDENRNGMYYSFCQKHGLGFYDYMAAKKKFGRSKAFEGACEEALNEVKISETQYDVILVDEAQDLSPAFLQLCYEYVSTEKRLIYAYDELQNLNNKSLPSPEEIFGKKPDGTPNVSFQLRQQGKPQQDIILEKCYRNSRPVLATAHALGFGVYREPSEHIGTGLIQMFDQSELWTDVGYEVTDGKLADGHNVSLARSENSSPKFLEKHSSIDDLVQFHSFADKDEQMAWLVAAIQENLGDNDELEPDDIIVINTNPLTTRDEVGSIRKILFEQGINSHLAGVDTSPDIFFEADGDSVTFTGIFRAKGNEAGMVYIINAQDCYSSFGNLATIRNRLFTAITRSKAWVRVLGVGDEMEKLSQEFKQVKDNDFQLKFRYPTEEERERLNIVNRDMTREEKTRVKKGAQNLASLLSDLEEGKVFIEDLGEDQLKKLQTILGGGKKSK